MIGHLICLGLFWVIVFVDRDILILIDILILFLTVFDEDLLELGEESLLLYFILFLILVSSRVDIRALLFGQDINLILNPKIPLMKRYRLHMNLFE